MASSHDSAGHAMMATTSNTKPTTAIVACTIIMPIGSGCCFMDREQRDIGCRVELATLAADSDGADEMHTAHIGAIGYQPGNERIC